MQPKLCAKARIRWPVSYTTRDANGVDGHSLIRCLSRLMATITACDQPDFVRHLVHESQGGRPTLAFSFLIVVKPLSR